MDVLKLVIQVIAVQLGKKPEEIKKENTLEELGTDMLDNVEITMALEDELNISLSDDDIEKVKTVGDLVNIISSKLESGH